MVKRMPLRFSFALLLLLAACNGAVIDEYNESYSTNGGGPSSDVIAEEMATEQPPATVEPTVQAPVEGTAQLDRRTHTPEKAQEMLREVKPTTQATDTPMPTPTETGTNTPMPTNSPTFPAEPTATPTAQPTATPSMTAIVPPTLTPTRTPLPASVVVRSHTSYALGSQVIVVGELLNGAQSDVFGMRISGQFYDSSDKVIAVGQVHVPFGKLEIERSAPFRMTVDVDPSRVRRYELSVIYENMSIVEFRELDVLGARVAERDGRLAVVGELYNGHEMELASLVVATAFYDENGDVVEVVDRSFSGEIIAPGSVLSFEIPLLGVERTYVKLRVFAQGQLNLVSSF